MEIRSRHKNFLRHLACGRGYVFHSLAPLQLFGDNDGMQIVRFLRNYNSFLRI